METRRLQFQPHLVLDCQRILKLDTSNQMQALGLTDMDLLEGELSRLQRMVDEPQKNWKFWNLIDKESGRIAGNCLLHNIKKHHQRAELGYFTHEGFRGKGLMKEAVKCVLSHAFHDLHFHRMEAYTSTENHASIAILKSMGFQHEGLLKGHYFTGEKFLDSLAFGLLKEDWLEPRS